LVDEVVRELPGYDEIRFAIRRYLIDLIRVVFALVCKICVLTQRRLGAMRSPRAAFD